MSSEELIELFTQAKDRLENYDGSFDLDDVGDIIARIQAIAQDRRATRIRSALSQPALSGHSEQLRKSLQSVAAELSKRPAELRGPFKMPHHTNPAPDASPVRSPSDSFTTTISPVPDTGGLVTVAWRVPNLVSGWNATCNSEQAAEWRANVRPVEDLVSRAEAAAELSRLRALNDEAIKDAALFSAGIEFLEKALSATIQPLEHASQCLDGIVSMDDEDQGKDGGSATCQAVKRTVDRALKNVNRALEGSKR